MSAYLTKIFIGISYGISFPLTITIVDYWLKDLGVSNAAIGLFSLIHLPFMLKFFWGIFIENYDIPILSCWMSRYKSWLILSYIGLILGILMMAFSSPQSSLVFLILGASLVSIADGCKNVVLYPYQLIDSNKNSIGFIASCVNLGHRLGGIFVKVSVLQIAHFCGWPTAYTFAAALTFIIMIVTLFLKEPDQSQIPSLNKPLTLKDAWRTSFYNPLMDFFKDKSHITVVAVICLYKIADFMMQKMSRMFCIEQGFSKLEIANIVQFYGSIMVIAGSILGGFIIKKISLKKSMCFALLLHGFSLASYLLLLNYGKNSVLLSSIITLEALSGGIMSTCFISFFYTISSNMTIYSVLWALHEFAGLMFMSTSGIVSHWLGWNCFFTIVPLLIMPSFVLINLLRNSHASDQ